jgi:hypothetical protein
MSMYWLKMRKPIQEELQLNGTCQLLFHADEVNTLGWVGPRASLDMVEKRNIPSPNQESNPQTLTAQPIASHYTDWATPAHDIIYSFQIIQP